MSKQFFAEALFAIGYTDLISVIPPFAQLTPSSAIPQAQVGKVPGRRLANGLWAGFGWRKHVTTAADVHQWSLDGANIGLRADRFPGVDIDCKDAVLAKQIEDAAVRFFGDAPVRIGKPPKRLLMYRTETPFGRMRLWIDKDEDHHLVEILGQGQQYVIYGIHPQTGRAYDWDEDLTEAPAAKLTPITRDQADKFLGALATTLGTAGWKLTREGDGRLVDKTAGAPAPLRAPSLDLLRQAVRSIPNDNELFPDRTSYIKMGYAIRAAGSADPDEAQAVFAEWAAKWDGNDRMAGNDPETVLADWRRFRAPFAVGWNYIAELARGFGFDTTGLDFDVVDEKPSEAPLAAPSFSDQWLADRVVARRRGAIRYAPQKGQFFVWSDGKWQPDAELLAEDAIKQELRVVGVETSARGGTSIGEQREAAKRAEAICSAGKVSAVISLAKSDRAIAVSIPALDHDPTLLNTPAGIVDLKTGVLGPHNPDALCTRSTSVPPDFAGQCPRWRRFLAEATDQNAELQAYLQRLCGYALTGLTREQQLTFIFGNGGNGKGTFLNVLTGIMGDYAVTASMDTFTASRTEQHTTDVAMLAGARLVTASESEAGKRWNEARVKQLTGGDLVTARFMRQDNFTYLPQFKLVFTGNHKPEIRDVDAAMRRRIQMVSFHTAPKVVDKELGTKLREEWPAILAWMIAGCVQWQAQGLTPPQTVLDSTAAYFGDEDATGRWMAECLAPHDDATVTSQALYVSWREWANRNGEYAGSLKRMSAALIARKIERWHDTMTRKLGFKGVRIIETNPMEGI